MQILGNIFNAIIFVSAIGGIFCVLSLFINHILRCTLPLWFPLCGMILFCVPFLSPDVFLISPETQEWLNGFYIACWVWVCGCGILFVYDTIRSIMAKRALKGYQICTLFQNIVIINGFFKDLFIRQECDRSSMTVFFTVSCHF